MLLVSNGLIEEFFRLSVSAVNQVQRQFVSFLDQKYRLILGRKISCVYLCSHSSSHNTVSSCKPH